MMVMYGWSCMDSGHGRSLHLGGDGVFLVIRLDRISILSVGDVGDGMAVRLGCSSFCNDLHGHSQHQLQEHFGQIMD